MYLLLMKNVCAVAILLIVLSGCSMNINGSGGNEGLSPEASGGFNPDDYVTKEELPALVEEGIEAYIAEQEALAAEEQAEQRAVQEQQELEQAERLADLSGGDLVDDDPVLGDENAPVTIVEFSDYRCPFCQRYNTQTAPQIIQEYVESGDVKIVFRDFPLPSHEPAATERAIAANCTAEQSGNEGYFAFHDVLFGDAFSQNLSEDDLVEIALESGVTDEAAYRNCLQDDAQVEEVRADTQFGSSIGVNATPYFFVNGTPVRGAQPYSVFEQVIEAELRAAEGS